jgi:hypothetical protein
MRTVVADHDAERYAGALGDALQAFNGVLPAVPVKKQDGNMRIHYVSRHVGLLFRFKKRFSTRCHEATAKSNVTGNETRKTTHQAIGPSTDLVIK